MRKWLPLVLALVLVLIGAESIFEIHEGERGLLLQFGKVTPHDYRPGLHWKWPLLQQVVRLDRRVAAQTLPAHSYALADRPSIETTALLHWRIVDDAVFYSHSGADPLQVSHRLEALAGEALQQALKQCSLAELVADSSQIGEAVAQALRAAVKQQGLGVAVLDVELKEIHLPKQELAAIYQRMQDEQDAALEQLKIDGAAAAQQIRAKADQAAARLNAEADQQIARIQGEGEAKVATLYARTSAQDSAFFAFYRGLQAYREAFGQGGNVWVVSPDSGVLHTLSGSAATTARPAKP